MEAVFKQPQAKTQKTASFIQKLEEEGVVIKEREKSREEMPDLFFDAVPFWNAFQELSASRQSGFGIGHIPYSEISCWLDENDIISMETRRHYRRFISFIDGLWVGKMNEKQDRGNNNKGGNK